MKNLMVVLTAMAMTSFVTVITAAPQGITPQSLAGLWESDGKSQGGIGATLEFKADGTCIQTSTVLVDAYYRVEGDKLFITEKPSTNAADTRAGGTVSFKDGKFLMTGPGGPPVEKERVGAAQEGQPPIVGAWKYRHPTGATAFERYTADGRLSLRIVLGSQAGKFSMEGDTLFVTLDNGPATRMKLKLDGDQMKMTDAASTETQWHRVTSGAWYQTAR